MTEDTQLRSHEHCSLKDLTDTVCHRCPLAILDILFQDTNQKQRKMSEQFRHFRPEQKTEMSHGCT